jgi:GAF domain-containing protein
MALPLPADADRSVPDLRLGPLSPDEERVEAILRENERRWAIERGNAETFQNISTQLISAGETRELFEAVVEGARQLMSADAATMQMLEDDTTLRLLAWRNFPRESSRHWRYVKIGAACICGQAMASGQRVIIEDVEQWDAVRSTKDLEEYRRSRLRAMQSTPLTSRAGTKLGMLSTHWREPRQLGGHDFRRFDVLARQAADLIERASSEAALRRTEEQLRTELRRKDEVIANLQRQLRDHLPSSDDTPENRPAVVVMPKRQIP